MIIKNILHRLSKPILDRVFELQNIHQNDECYIIGDGVSLKWFDLHLLPKKKIFALNWAVFRNEFQNLSFDYAINTGPYQFTPFVEHFQFVRKDLRQGIICKHYRKLIKKNKQSTFFLNLSNYPFISSRNIYFLFKYLKSANFKFSSDCLQAGENMFAGSLKCAIALAILMGFTKVYLVGCDYTHEDSRMGHWYESMEGKSWPHPNYQKTYFEISSNYTKLITITASGRGSVLPSISYKDFTGKDLLYRENTELASYEDLKILSSWPGYRIF